MTLEDELRLLVTRAMENALSPVVSHLDTRLAALEKQADADVGMTRSMLTALADEVADLNQLVTGQKAQLAQAQQSTRAASSDASRPPVDAIRALIAAVDQLKAIADASGSHADVVLGQRANLVANLQVLGAREVFPEPGSVLDLQRMRTDTRAAPTSDAQLDGTVSEVIESGWEWMDGSDVIRPASVRVYVHQAPTPASVSAAVVAATYGYENFVHPALATPADPSPSAGHRAANPAAPGAAEAPAAPPALPVDSDGNA